MAQTRSPGEAGVSIEFVNHASFILEFNRLRVINDPWFFGSAFNDGWGLLCDYEFDLERFKDIDYIWISHEHPDHFSPLVLQSIPEALRKEITVIFQSTKDRKVLNFCSRLGFQTRELPHQQPLVLRDQLRIVCGNVPFYDSWILYECHGIRVLNINDCIVDGEARAQDIRKVVGQVDVLFTQFSYAGWKGNVDDSAMRRESAAAKLEAMKAQITVFEPRWTVPFASFAYFSHEENRHSNDSINKPQDAVEAITSAGSTAVLMYPGDTWTVGDAWRNPPAAKKYEDNYDLSDKKFATSAAVDESTLLECASGYIRRLKSRNNRLLLKLIRWMPVVELLRAVDIRVRDSNSVYNFSLEEGLVKKSSDASYDVVMHSSSLEYLLKFEWGFDTLTINGRFETDMDGFKKMKKMFAIGPFNNTGRHLGFGLLFDWAFLRMLRGAALRLRGLSA